MTTTNTPSIKSIPGRLARARTAIDNAQSNTAIAAKLAAYGYSAAVIAVGQTLLDAATSKQTAQEDEYAQQLTATDSLEATWQQAQSTYSPLVQLARLALKGDRGSLDAMQLGGERKRTVSGWASQARAFYTHALHKPDIMARLARFNITEAQLSAGLAEVSELEDAQARQSDERGEAQSATQARDAALDALDEWMGEFIEVARVALRSDPQLLEALGVRVLS